MDHKHNNRCYTDFAVAQIQTKIHQIFVLWKYESIKILLRLCIYLNFSSL